MDNEDAALLIAIFIAFARRVNVNPGQSARARMILRPRYGTVMRYIEVALKL